MDNALGPLSLFVLILIGVAMLWSIRLSYRTRLGVADDAVRLILTIAGWVLILVGILGTATQAFIFAAPMAWIVILAIVIMAVGRYRTAENYALVWSLCAAAERGIPLEQAARAFSMERSDELGLRAARLAELLEGGTPLSLALADTRTQLPTNVLVALRVGIETGDLGPALGKIGRFDDDSDLLVRSIFEKCFYLAIVANIIVGILTFIMWKIVPVFAQMFEEFELELPPMTLLGVFVSEFFLNYWFLFFPLFGWVPFFLVFGLLHYVGWLPRSIPLVNRCALRLDAGLVMRSLAFAVRQQRPLPEMIWLLARLYPRWSIRSRLTKAGTAINNGEHWCPAMRRAGLLRSSDAAVLEAAERSGNLEWALEEMADSSIRALAYRLRLALNVVFPFVVFSFGLIIAFFVIGLFMPLVDLIQGLA
jgi:MSHA biogenesis protein MshG